MDSNQDASLSGLVSVSSDKIETVSDINGSVNSLNKLDTSTSTSTRLNVVSDDENEGFASGEEEAFETLLDDKKLVLAKETLANVDETETFSEPSEFPVLKVDDDGEKEENSDSNTKRESNLDLIEDKVSEKSEVVVANGVRTTTEGDAIVEEVKVDTPAPGVAVVTNSNTDEVEVEDEVDDDEDEDVLLVGGSDGSETAVDDVNVTSEGDVQVTPEDDSVDAEDETPAVESVDAKDVKVTPEDDSVVEAKAIDVDLPLPGVANVVVVTKIDDEASVSESVDAKDVKETPEGDSVVNDIDVVTKIDDETLVLESVDAKDVKETIEGDSVVDDRDVVTKIEDETPVSESVDAKDVKETSEGDSVVDDRDVTKIEDETPVSESVDAKDVETPEGDSVVDDIDVDTKIDDETPVSESVDAKDVKETPEGDSVVDDRDVVTKIDDETPVLESVDAKDVKETPEGDSVVDDRDGVVTKIDEETPVSESVDAKDVKENVEGDSVVEAKAIDVDLPLPGVAGVVVVTKAEVDGGVVAETDESGLSEKISSVLEEVVDKEVVGVTDSKFSPLDVEDVEKEVDYAGQENGPVVVKTALKDVESDSVVGLEGDVDQSTEVLTKDIAGDADNGIENGSADKFVLEDSAEKDDADEQGYTDGSRSDEEDTEEVIFESSEAAKQFIEELESGGGGSNTGGVSSQDRSQIDGQIVTDSDEDDDEDGKELFDSAALAALLKAAADGGSEGGNITFSSEDGSRLFTVERPAGLGPSLQAMRAAPRPPRANIFNPSSLMSANETEPNLSEEERMKLEKLQSIRVKFLRLVQRLGLSPDESVAAQVLYRLALIAGRQTGQSFSLDAAKRKAMELEADGKADLDFSVNILVIGKAGVGKSATINSIFGEEKTTVGAFQAGTGSVKEITGVVGGVTVRVFDTPGLRTSVMEQGYNRSVLASAKKFTKKNPPDIVLYVDRLDAQTRDHNDIPLLKTITTSLGSAIWRSAIVTFTHGASAPPEGSNGSPLSYEMFVTQRSHVVQQAIGQAVGDLRMMSPGLMNPVSLVENHQSCRKNREGQKVLPNGQTWRPQLLMLCYSMKILAEANSLTKPQDPFDSRKLFGFRVRSPPLPYMLSSMLQSRAHPKLAGDQGGDGGDSDVDLAELTDSDNEDEDEYDQLPPFKPLKRSQLSKLSKEQKKAYFDEYDYRVKLLQKKQWKEEVKRMKEMKKRGPDGLTGQNYQEEEGEGDVPAPVAVPLPDMALPPSFDSDNPAYRFRFLEPTSQFLARPVLDTHGWDHDCGYDGVNVEQTLAIANRFPAVVSVQVTKDKKDFSINMDSSVAAKHGENISTMAGFDIQPIGKQLAYIVRGETKFKNLKKNKTAAGLSVTFLGENIVTGLKVEDQITLGRQYSIIGSAGTVRFQTDSAYGANIEIQRRELDYPIGQVQSTIGLSIIKWRGDLALGFNSLAQFSAGRNSKVAVRAGINNKMSGQITVKTSSSEYLSLALAAVIPSVISAYKKLWSGVGDGDKYSPY